MKKESLKVFFRSIRRWHFNWFREKSSNKENLQQHQYFLNFHNNILKINCFYQNHLNSWFNGNCNDSMATKEIWRTVTTWLPEKNNNTRRRRRSLNLWKIMLENAVSFFQVIKENLRQTTTSVASMKHFSVINIAIDKTTEMYEKEATS